jgi:flagellar hook-associated protein 1 FlgK
MAGNLLNIGKTGLYAAQAGLATTGHNIANANVAGYSRQLVIQSTATAQNLGNGFVGSGTQVSDIRRYSDGFLNTQVRSAQSAASALNAYQTQISQVDNLLADTTSGLSPALQGFFKSVQDVSANAGSTPSRQSLLSSAEGLAARFQNIDGRLEEIRSGVNSQLTTNVTTINSYAQQIAKLNDQISTMATSTGHAPNDLLDTRDQVVLDLNKQIKATVTPGDNGAVTVSIGNGQPLVVGKNAFQLAATTSPADLSRVQVGYVNGSKITPLAESQLGGGELGGLLEFRSTSLDAAQNALGRIAISLAAAVNAQHRLGQDSSGAMGADLFHQAVPEVGANRNRNAPDPLQPLTVDAAISDPSQLTTSDYKVAYDASSGGYSVTRLSDRAVTKLPVYSEPGPQSATIDGVTFSISGKQVEGDEFLVRPTINGAAQFKVLLHDVGELAAAAPVTTNPAVANRGGASIGEAVVDSNFLPASSFSPATLSFVAASGTLTGFAAGQTVSMTSAGVTQSYVAGTDPIPYTAGASYSFGGVTLAFTGQPLDGDKFSVTRNLGGVSDNRNMVLIGALQGKPVLDQGSATYQSAFAQLVSAVGNKAREVQLNGKASDALLAQASTAQQNVAGVNLDEEAANLLKYQQAYQAAGKVMQIAGTMFDTLLSLGR